jgi:hypothetical protein
MGQKLTSMIITNVSCAPFKTALEFPQFAP